MLNTTVIHLDQLVPGTVPAVSALHGFSFSWRLQICPGNNFSGHRPSSTLSSVHMASDGWYNQLSPPGPGALEACRCNCTHPSYRGSGEDWPPAGQTQPRYSRQWPGQVARRERWHSRALCFDLLLPIQSCRRRLLDCQCCRLLLFEILSCFS